MAQSADRKWPLWKILYMVVVVALFLFTAVVTLGAAVYLFMGINPVWLVDQPRAGVHRTFTPYERARLRTLFWRRIAAESPAGKPWTLKPSRTGPKPRVHRSRTLELVQSRSSGASGLTG